VGAVMVVGAGIGGMNASLDLAESGYKVYLVEETTSIGGRMAQLDKTFPTNDCSMCTISPKLIEVAKHLNIEILTNTTVEQVDGEAGRFKVTVAGEPRYVDTEKCNACGDCVDVCPVRLPSEFDEDLGERKAIYKRYPQAIPSTYAISKMDRAPCRDGCPAHTNVHAYVSLTKEGKYQEALDVIRRRIPLPGSLGRICHHPCEGECRRAEVDSPISIAAIKRHAADHADLRKGAWRDPTPVERPEGKKIAVVGSGPAGLTAADDLSAMGYEVTIFEASDELGGMLRHGIPHYRLPREVLDQEIKVITDDERVEVRTGVRIGKDVTLGALDEQGYDAVFLSVGAEESRRIPVPGADKEGVLWGIEFLKAVNHLEKVPLGKRVVVVGGGNVAMDVARSARRLGAEVDITCLESRDEMPANPWEIEEAVEEGCRLFPALGPVELLGDDRVTGIEMKACTRVFDDQGRFAPEFDEANTQELACDQVIFAIGQQSNLDVLEGSGAEPGERGLLGADPQTLQTAVEWIFAGGDAQGGAASAVEAIRDGHEAAVSIDHWLRGEPIPTDRWVKPSGENWREIPADVVAAKRYDPELKPADERVRNWNEVSFGLTSEQAQQDAARCLACAQCCECFQCVEACKAEAINHFEPPQRQELDVGSVILMPGFEAYDPEKEGVFGKHRMPNVITSMEFERILSASGPTQGHVVRPSDHQEPKKIAWIQCVGSRDWSDDHNYCSSVCCMYAIKEAVMAVDHCPEAEVTIYYNDIRSYGKGFEAYYERARENDHVRFRRGLLPVMNIIEDPVTGNLTLRSGTDDGTFEEQEYDLVVLSVGLRPSPSTRRLAEACGVELNRFGFLEGAGYNPGRTTREGIFAAGAAQAPMDIPETVMGANAAAAQAAGLLAEARGTLTQTKTYPEERQVGEEAPRVGVFVCRCGTNIARAVNVPEVVEYAKTLGNVVYSNENLFTCSTDTQEKITDAVKEHNLNRLVVASCTPRTHEPLFQDTLREAGVNKYLFEMANIRDQCSWVHFDQPDKATAKAKDLVRMAVARAETLEPLEELSFEVDQSALVVGGGVTGMTAALAIAEQGFPCTLVEKEPELGGLAARHHSALGVEPPMEYCRELAAKVEADDRIAVLKSTRITGFTGHVGKFTATVQSNGTSRELRAGAMILAVGGEPYQPTEYHYDESDLILTQLELDELMHEHPERIKEANTIAMIQCVGSREEDHQYCSRVCCQVALKNAIKIKQINPLARVFVLFRDIRTYGFNELYYEEARKLGVMFIRYTRDRRPEVTLEDGKPVLKVFDALLDEELLIRPDYLTLSAAIRPVADASQIASMLKLPLSSDGFFLEAHLKLRPLDFASEGIFLAGVAQAPKSIAESISQAQGAASRAATVISKKRMWVPGTISVVEPKHCAACLTCVRSCPYEVPVVRDGVAYIEPASCQGCGVCASVCPRHAIDTQHYKDRQILSKLQVL
jgi:heterodisulfide reductase subunit A-like polyferredoxin